jgi:GNAT superfamily N-acetyltransferase
MIHTFVAQFRDMGAVTSLNFQTMEFPLEVEEIKSYLLEDEVKSVLLAKVSTKHIAFACVSIDRLAGVTVIDAIGTHPQFRKNGVATLLVNKADLLVKGNKTRILVPSYQIEDKEDPWNIEQWLWKAGFKANVTVPGCHRYNRDYDYYVFERLSP